MKLIQNPWKNDFLELVEKAEKSIKITSPFIKENICKELLNVKNKNTSLNIITSFKLMNVHSGSLDISALEKIIESKGVVKNFNKLHSKIYLFDDNQAVAKAYDAACTPDFYLFDAEDRLIYRGQLDDSRPGNGIPVSGSDLRNAIDSIIYNRHLNELQKPSIGCSIKWK